MPNTPTTRSSTDRAYSFGQWCAALLLATLLGWAGIALPSLLGADPESRRGLIEQGLFLAILGLPVALVIVLIFVAYPLNILMRAPVSYPRAARWGFALSLGLALLSIVTGRLHGLSIARDPDFFSQIGGGDHIRSIDGILTPYGWWVTAQNTVIFVGICTLSALLIRAILGPGRPGENAEATR